MTVETLRVVLADDHPMVRYGIAAVLADAERVELVGEAADGQELLEVVARTSPDVVLTDLAMPRLAGIGATAALRETHPDLPVLVLTMHADDEAVFAALRAGARGYLVKGASQEEVTRAITAVHAGGVVFGASLASRIGELLSPSPARTATEPAACSSTSPTTGAPRGPRSSPTPATRTPSPPRSPRPRPVSPGSSSGTASAAR